MRCVGVIGMMGVIDYMVKLNRKYTIHFLTQEEPASGDADDREVLKEGCPSMGLIEFESDASNWQALFESFQNFMRENCNSTILDKTSFPQIESRVDTV